MANCTCDKIRAIGWCPAHPTPRRKTGAESRCICTNRALVASCVHPYCAAHVPPEMEEEIARLTRDLAAARALLPTAEELAAVHRAHGSLPYDNGIAYAALKGWLARLEAARVEGER